MKPLPRDRQGRIKRISGRTLQRIREAWLYDHPLCVMCQAKDPPEVTPATQLDHIVALTNGGPDFDCDDGGNRQGLCDACHEAKTRTDLGYSERRVIGLDGFPVDPS